MQLDETQKLIVQNQPAAKKLGTVAAFTRNALEQKRFSYTDAFLGGEPTQTLCFSFLDGVDIEAGKAEYARHEPINTTDDPRGLLLVSLNPELQIEALIPKEVPIPGTHSTTIIKEKKLLGTVAFVPDVAPTRTARMLVYQQGWPVRGRDQMAVPTEASRKSLAKLVEWRWLELEVKKPMPVFGARELHAALLERDDVREALGLASSKKGGAR
jgi:hypothetical protein